MLLGSGFREGRLVLSASCSLTPFPGGRFTSGWWSERGGGELLARRGAERGLVNGIS